MRRTIYSFQPRLKRSNQQGTAVTIAWNSRFLIETLKYIGGLKERDKTVIKAGEWFFSLGEFSLDVQEGNPQHEDCIYGYFEGVRIGPVTRLKRESTLKTRLNPKVRDESEIRKTHFYIRLRDGLLLLDGFKENVVSIRRLEEYLREKASEVYQRNRIEQFYYENIISQGFLDQLQNFDVVRLARIRLRVQDNIQYDTSDAVGNLQELSKPMRANYLDLYLGKKNARKNGLNIDSLREFLQRIVSREEEVITGVIEGSRSDGGPTCIKLRGIEEKFKNEFPTDPDGEVASPSMYEFMIKLGKNHN